MTCFIPEYAIGIRAFRTIPQDAFGLPRCQRHAIHGGAVGAWEYRDGRKIIHWERMTP